MEQSTLQASCLRQQIETFFNSKSARKIWPEVLKQDILMFIEAREPDRSIVDSCKEIGIDPSNVYRWQHRLAVGSIGLPQVLSIAQKRTLSIHYQSRLFSFELRLG